METGPRQIKQQSFFDLGKDEQNLNQETKNIYNQSQEEEEALLYGTYKRPISQIVIRESQRSYDGTSEQVHQEQQQMQEKRQAAASDHQNLNKNYIIKETNPLYKFAHSKTNPKIQEPIMDQFQKQQLLSPAYSQQNVGKQGQEKNKINFQTNQQRLQVDKLNSSDQKKTIRLTQRPSSQQNKPKRFDKEQNKSEITYSKERARQSIEKNTLIGSQNMSHKIKNLNQDKKKNLPNETGTNEIIQEDIASIVDDYIQTLRSNLVDKLTDRKADDQNNLQQQIIDDYGSSYQEGGFEVESQKQESSQIDDITYQNVENNSNDIAEQISSTKSNGLMVSGANVTFRSDIFRNKAKLNNGEFHYDKGSDGTDSVKIDSRKSKEGGMKKAEERYEYAITRNQKFYEKYGDLDSEDQYSDRQNSQQQQKKDKNLLFCDSFQQSQQNSSSHYGQNRLGNQHYKPMNSSLKSINQLNPDRSIRSDSQDGQYFQDQEEVGAVYPSQQSLHVAQNIEESDLRSFDYGQSKPITNENLAQSINQPSNQSDTNSHRNNSSKTSLKPSSAIKQFLDFQDSPDQQQVSNMQLQNEPKSTVKIIVTQEEIRSSANKNQQQLSQKTSNFTLNKKSMQNVIEYQSDQFNSQTNIKQGSSQQSQSKQKQGAIGNKNSQKSNSPQNHKQIQYNNYQSSSIPPKLRINGIKNQTNEKTEKNGKVLMAQQVSHRKYGSVNRTKLPSMNHIVVPKNINTLNANKSSLLVNQAYDADYSSHQVSSRKYKLGHNSSLKKRLPKMQQLNSSTINESQNILEYVKHQNNSPGMNAQLNYQKGVRGNKINYSSLPSNTINNNGKPNVSSYQPNFSQYTEEYFKMQYQKAKNKRIADYFDQVENDNETKSTIIPSSQKHGFINEMQGPGILSRDLFAKQSPTKKFSDQTQFQNTSQINKHNLVISPTNQYQRSMIDTEQAFSLVNQIKEVYGVAENDGHQNTKLISHSSGFSNPQQVRNDYEESNNKSQMTLGSNNYIQKWDQVVKFMEKNPQIMMEMLPSGGQSRKNQNKSPLIIRPIERPSHQLSPLNANRPIMPQSIPFNIQQQDIIRKMKSRGLSLQKQKQNTKPAQQKIFKDFYVNNQDQKQTNNQTQMGETFYDQTLEVVGGDQNIFGVKNEDAKEQLLKTAERLDIQILKSAQFESLKKSRDEGALTSLKSSEGHNQVINNQIQKSPNIDITIKSPDSCEKIEKQPMKRMSSNKDIDTYQAATLNESLGLAQQQDSIGTRNERPAQFTNFKQDQTLKAVMLPIQEHDIISFNRLGKEVTGTNENSPENIFKMKAKVSDKDGREPWHFQPSYAEKDTIRSRSREILEELNKKQEAIRIQEQQLIEEKEKLRLERVKIEQELMQVDEEQKVQDFQQEIEEHQTKIDEERNQLDLERQQLDELKQELEQRKKYLQQAKLLEGKMKSLSQNRLQLAKELGLTEQKSANKEDFQIQMTTQLDNQINECELEVVKEYKIDELNNESKYNFKTNTIIDVNKGDISDQSKQNFATGTQFKHPVSEDDSKQMDLEQKNHIDVNEKLNEQNNDVGQQKDLQQAQEQILSNEQIFPNKVELEVQQNIIIADKDLDFSPDHQMNHKSSKSLIEKNNQIGDDNISFQENIDHYSEVDNNKSDNQSVHALTQQECYDGNIKQESIHSRNLDNENIYQSEHSTYQGNNGYNFDGPKGTLYSIQSYQSELTLRDKNYSVLDYTIKEEQDRDDTEQQLYENFEMQDGQEINVSASAQTLKTYKSTSSSSVLFDWAFSEIMSDVKQGKIIFNSDKNESIFKEDELDYILEMFRNRHKDFKKSDIVQKFYDKAIDTLENVMAQLNARRLFNKIRENYQEVNVSTTFKLLVRCKLMIQARNMVYETLKILIKHAKLVQEIKLNVDSHLDASIDPNTKQALEYQASKLPRFTEIIRSNILQLRDEYKLLAKTAALTNKNTVVSNVFIYQKKDAMRHVIAEYENIRKLLQLFDIQTLPYISGDIAKKPEGI